MAGQNGMRQGFTLLLKVILQGIAFVADLSVSKTLTLIIKEGATAPLSSGSASTTYVTCYRTYVDHESIKF